MLSSSTSLIDLLRGVKDPEVPVLDIVDLGIVRGAQAEGDLARVTITPTYSGCPAMQVIEREIETTLKGQGFREVEITTVLSPAWTTDWMSEEAKEKLRAYGIAPPGKVSEAELVPLGAPPRAVPCPYCGSSNTKLESEFGATACKAIHYCRSCQQPFEQFKAI